MAGIACIQLIIAVLTRYINETQSTWQGGSGEVNPVLHEITHSIRRHL